MSSKIGKILRDKLCKTYLSKTRGQFHQHSTSSFSVSNFILNLLAHRVQCMAQKLGSEYHKFGMPTVVSYA
jgi:hypothetical protein